MSEVEAEATVPARRALRLWWPHLPLWLLGALPVTLGWLVVRTVAPGLTVVSLVLDSLVVVPAFVPLLCAAQVLLTGEHVRVPDLVRGWGRRYSRAVVAGLPVTAALLLTATAFDVWWATRQLWVLASLGLGLTVTVVLLFTLVVALPLAEQPPRLPLVRCWLLALATAARTPVPVLAVLSVAGLAVWATSSTSVALSILLPGPLALVWAAALATAADHGSGLRGRAPVTGTTRT